MNDSIGSVLNVLKTLLPCVGSHGQLGHGDLSPQEEPRVMEALMGMSMSTVAAGGWHSVCTSGKRD